MLFYAYLRILLSGLFRKRIASVASSIFQDLWRFLLFVINDTPSEWLFTQMYSVALYKLYKPRYSLTNFIILKRIQIFV